MTDSNRRFSFISLAAHALQHHRNWQPFWRDAEPKKQYDVIIIGGGGQGLATAYYLAKNHGVRNVAVIERGWLGGGNTGRNTQAVRSNYFWPQSAKFFEHSLRLYETMSCELNLNVMLSQRGIINLAHSQGELDGMRRTVNAIQLHGIDSRMLSAREIEKLEPLINIHCRYPIVGGFVQKRSGIARHDAVAWGYARGASEHGVDIIQQCEVTGLAINSDRISAVQTSRGRISAGKVAFAVAGHSSVLAGMADLRLPITSMALQAMVSEPIKPCLNSVVASSAVHVYVSQSDRGELVIGGGADVYSSYAQRGGIPLLQENIAALLELFPAFRRLRLMRQWAGIVDITPDTMPILGLTPVRGLYISGGWGTGGFKAVPAGGETLAYTIANDSPHPLIQAFSLERFQTGALIEEGAAAGVAH